MRGLCIKELGHRVYICILRVLGGKREMGGLRDTRQGVVERNLFEDMFFFAPVVLGKTLEAVLFLWERFCNPSDIHKFPCLLFFFFSSSIGHRANLPFCTL